MITTLSGAKRSALIMLATLALSACTSTMQPHTSAPVETAGSKGMICAPKAKDSLKGGIGSTDHSTMNHGGDIYAPAMKTMHENMSIPHTGDADADFMRGMIPHHQGAIDMAKIVLAHGKDPQVKKLAEDVIRAQESEIAFMRDWLAKRGQ